VYLSKVDIADGFYHIWVRTIDAPKLDVLFPSTDGEAYLIGFPLALSMGWTEPPKIFTAATETVADLTNVELSSGTIFGPHTLEAPSEAAPPAGLDIVIAPCATSNPPPSTILRPTPLPRGAPPKGATHYCTPLALWDVYVDDFWGMVQGGTQTRRRVKHALLHTLGTVLRPPDSDDSVHCQDPVSVKKMAKGDSDWSTVKVIMGWAINTLDQTISFRAHRMARIREVRGSISPTHRLVSLKKWQQVLGELRSMALVIPTAIGLFYVLQQAL
jgi:hypothetical protein